jgi:dye decolorizing peroxidase
VVALPSQQHADSCDDLDGAAAVGALAADAAAAADRGEGPAGVGRREVAGLLAAGALGALAGTAGGLALGNRRRADAGAGPGLSDVGARTVAFFGERQGGIITPARPQAHVWVAGLDLVPGVDAARLRTLLQGWSAAGAKLASGSPLGAVDDPVVAGLGPSALTVTIGFGPSMFGKAGLPASLRPDALAPLPPFPGERLDPQRGDGDLGLVVAADDPLVVAHSARVLRRLAGGVATVRWEQVGFNAARGSGSETATGRNLMGQLDGTNNPKPTDPDFADRVCATGPSFMRGGSYLVVRRIRMLLDDWEAVPAAEQERVIGRRKDTGAPLSGGTEQTPSNFGSPAIAANAHIRLANPAFNQGAAMLRRGFSYVDGAEAGLLFLAWQADPRRGFIPVQQHLVGVDALGRYIRHETSALFAMPAGASPGSYVGAQLVERL